jgi:amidase
MRTTAGSYALVDSIVPGDAAAVAQLRARGAIIIGKANLSELAHFKGDVPSGWSARGGQTQSAYVSGGNPGGSSSGSAVGVSAGFAAGAIGTETDGSLSSPCAKAAVYCVKATVGLISRAGMVPLTRTADTMGPIARSTYDVAPPLGAMAGRDDGDPASKSYGRQTAAEVLDWKDR